MRRRLGALGLRYTPSISFTLDESILESIRMEQIFSEVRSLTAAAETEESQAPAVDEIEADAPGDSRAGDAPEDEAGDSPEDDS